MPCERLELRSSQWGRRKEHWSAYKDKNKEAMDGMLTGSLLRDPETGRCCCLGLYLIGCGAMPEDLDGVPEPCHLAGEDQDDWPDYVPAWLRLQDGAEDEAGVSAMIFANDDAGLSDGEKVERLAQLFGRHGIEVVFIDDEPGGTGGPEAAEAPSLAA